LDASNNQETEMHSAIVVAKMPSQEGHEGRQSWAAFLATIDKLQGNPALLRLSENVWQADFQRSPAALAQLVAGLELHRYVYGILPLADAPQWLPVGFDPKSI
jgi:hypothetical protein